MGRLEGKVAFVTGAARGQGRSHAVRMAEEGADIIALDICSPIETVPYPAATPEDLAETVRLVEAADRRIHAVVADARDSSAVKQVVDDGLAAFGRLDVASINHGICTFGTADELTDEQWAVMCNVNLISYGTAVRAVIPPMIAGGAGGAIVLTSSLYGLKGWEGVAHYVASKHGVTGLGRALAKELAPHMIRVNTLHPTSTRTPMIENEFTYRLFAPDMENPTLDTVGAIVQETMNLMPIPYLETRDVTNALLFLASDEARYITGVALPIDAGASLK